MPSMSYVGKHSKDKILSVYLPKRVYIDDGDGMEPLQGIVRLEPKMVNTVTTEEAVFAQVNVYFIYECYDFDMEIVDYTLFERTVQLYPRTSEELTKLKNVKVILPDKYHFLFEFKIPHDLPPSITLNPGFVYFGRPIGVSYEVSAHIGLLNNPNDLKYRRSRAAMRFRKSSTYFPLLRDIKPSDTTSKTYLGGTKPLKLTAKLDHEIYRVGQSIIVTIEISNESKHDVNSIRISAKQVVEARIHTNDTEKYKCQVALLESSSGCPVRKYQNYSRQFTITPELLPNETYHTAQIGMLNMNETPQLAPSTRPEEGPKERGKGLTVSYYLNVHCSVSLAQDLIIKLPFIISGNDEKEDIKSEIPSAEPAAMINQLVSRGFTLADSKTALEKHNNNFEKAFDWLVANAQRQETANRAGAGAGASAGGAGDDFLINFEDEDKADDDAAWTLPGGTSNLAEDIEKATNTLVGIRTEFSSVVAAAAAGKLNTAPGDAGNSFQQLGQILNLAVLRMQDLMSEVSAYDSSQKSQSASALVAEQQKIVQLVRALVSKANAQLQQNIISLTTESLEKLSLLLFATREYLENSRNPDLRVKVRNLSEFLFKDYTRFKSVLPGQQEVDLTISTISAAVAELRDNIPSGAHSNPEALQRALDSINTDAGKLSLAFQQLGNASSGSPEQFLAIVQEYRTLLPRILLAGKAVIGGMTNDDAKKKYFGLLQLSGETNVRLLKAAKDVNQAPTDPSLKRVLENAAREVVEAMKRFLVATNALQTQLQQLGSQQAQHAASTSVSSPQPPIPQPAPLTPASTLSRKERNIRRDSWDDFVEKRVQQPASPPTPTVPKSDAADRLAALLRDIDAVQRIVLSQRSKPKRKSFIPNQGYAEVSGTSSILDQVFAITSAASQVISSSAQRQQEMMILGESQQSLTDDDQKSVLEWEKGLVAAASALVAAMTDLVQVGSKVAEASESVQKFVSVLTTASSATTRILIASRATDNNNSQVQRNLDVASNQVLQSISQLLDYANKALAAPIAPTKTPNIGDVEEQMRALQLEQALDKQRQNLYVSRRRSTIIDPVNEESDDEVN